jgi:outer membrane lipoprotein-sorting protein
MVGILALETEPTGAAQPDWKLSDSRQVAPTFGRAFVAVLRFLCVLAILSSVTSNLVRATEVRGTVTGSVDGLKDLMALFAGSKGVRAEFSESRYLSILTEPIETGGILYFSPPDYLARYTSQPDASSIVTDGKQVTLRDRTGTKTIDLGSSELARELVSSFAVLLRGDLTALNAGYEVELYSGKGSDSLLTSPWILDLKPRSSEVRDFIERTRVEGLGNRLTSMETLEKNGDRTLTTFSAVETGLEFDDEELEHLFSFKDYDRSR